MPCSTRIRREECAFALPLVHLLVPVRCVLFELAVRRRHHPATGLGAQSLVTGIGQDLHRGPVGQELDQSQMAGVGDVRAACGAGWTALQDAAFAVRDHHGLDGVLLVLAGDERVAVLAAGSGPADPDLGAVDDAVFPLEPMWSMTSARDRSRTSELTVQPRSASRGRISLMARVMVERSTPNQQASTSWVTP